MSMMQNELKKCDTTIEPVPSNKQPTPDSIKRLDNEISSKKCTAYEDGCEEWAGCPCTNYRTTNK